MCQDLWSNPEMKIIARDITGDTPGENIRSPGIHPGLIWDKTHTGHTIS